MFDKAHDEVLKDDTIENCERGLMRIKNEGKQICDTAILEYEKELIKLNNDIAEENEFLKGLYGIHNEQENNTQEKYSTQANRIKVQTDNIQKNIDYIKAKQTSLDNKDLGIYASYWSGFAQSRSDKNK